MRRMRAWLVRGLGLLAGSRRDMAIDAELESHLQLHIDDNIARGMTPAEARRDALLKLGGIAQTRERYRDRAGIPVIDAVRQDVRYALRTLRRQPAFAATAIATIALGIGAACAIFTVVYAVLLKPLPYAASDRLVFLAQRSLSSGQPEYVALPDFNDWREQATTLQGLGGAWQVTFNLTGVNEPERLTGAWITEDLLPVLAVHPLLGRFPSRALGDADQSAVIGYSLWRRQFAGDPSIVGRVVQLNGRPHTILGVMPDGFAFPPAAELWVPFVAEPGMNRGYHLLNVVGRMKPGVTIAQVRGELDAIAARSATLYPATNADWGAHVSSLLDGAVGSTRQPLLLLAAAVACVLLIACANVAALLVSRSAARRSEIMMRTAIGASRLRIAQQLLTESVVLALCGGAAGILLAAFSVDPLLALTSLPRAQEVSLNGPVLAFAVAISTATGLLFGLAPVASLGGQALAVANRAVTPTGRLRPILVGVEVALATILLAGAGLLIRSYERLQDVETGFEGDRILTVRFFLPRAAYPADRAADHYARMIDRLAALPEVEQAAAVSHFPFSTLAANAVFAIPGRQVARPLELNAEFRSATADYFRVMGIPLVRGRQFSAADRADTAFVAIVNRATADRYFHGQDPLEQSVQILGPKPRRIVGIVENIRHHGLDRAPEPEIYVPHAQFPAGAMFVTIRARTGDPARLAGVVRTTIRTFDRDLPIAEIRTFRDLLDATLSRRRFSVVLMTIFGAAALLLSTIGVYGVSAFTTSLRTREIGIRMALGARRSEIVKATVGQGLRPVVIGLLSGMMAALAAMRSITSMLYEIRPTDPATFGAVAVLLAGAAGAAMLAVARRAASVDPMVTLRHE